MFCLLVNKLHLTNRAVDINCEVTEYWAETGAEHLEKAEGGKQNRDGGIQVFEVLKKYLQ